jgi:hypothetical protein
VCSVGVHMVSELEALQKRLESSQLKTFNLTKSDLVKDHLRYLVYSLNEFWFCSFDWNYLIYFIHYAWVLMVSSFKTDFLDQELQSYYNYIVMDICLSKS